MSEIFFTIITQSGKKKIAKSLAEARPIVLSRMAVGSGVNNDYYPPEETQQNLKAPIWSADINRLVVDVANPNWVVAELSIPDSVMSQLPEPYKSNGFYIREVGVFDKDGDLFAIGKFPESFKPPISNGTNKQIYVRMMLEVTNASSVILQIDPNTAVANKQYVDQQVMNHTKQVDPHPQYATITAIQRQAYTALSTGGTAPAFTATASPAITAYVAGQRFRVGFHAGVSGASTINLNSLGAKPLKQYDYTGTKVNAVIATGQLGDVEYDGADFVILDPLPGFSAPPGEVQFFAMRTAPAGYLKANGAAVSRTTYAALFTAIGTAFGAGDGSTTFNLPDLRGEFLRGFDDGRGIDSGRTFGTLQAQSVQTHQHGIATIEVFNTAAFIINDSSGDGVVSADNSGASICITRSGRYFTDNAGSTETRPRNVALLACIKF
ncbi:phage-related tail fiber protein [Chitinivorax tropicus]|uniref:Phage-related tail fiber protein n=1 Tax=Chitinivorax tropicus TaxID=714531 RepID=A0A840MKP4_9PROT|nr:phage tail protein [Chitinivorax tropicus]MBB5017427.1 phage-related tail fiber protein [Chitinivorax tropicus]